MPAKFEAETVKIVAIITADGVPEITQVTLLIKRPVGRAGEMEQEVIVEPLLFRFDGLTVIGTPIAELVPSAPRKLMVGAEAPTERLTLAVFDPAELVAVIV